MKCADIHPLLSDMLDGELSADETTSVEDHLAGCADCREELAQLRSAMHALGSHLTLTASEGFDGRVMWGLDSSRPASSKSKSFLDVLIDFFQPGWRQVTVSAAVSLALLYIILAGSSIGGGTKTPPVNPYYNLDQQATMDSPEGYGKVIPGKNMTPINNRRSKGEHRWSEDSPTS